MSLGSCMILLCIGPFLIPALAASREDFEKDLVMFNKSVEKFRQIYLGSQAEFAVENIPSMIRNSDDEVVIVGSSEPDEIRYFNPVDEFWQHGKCIQLNVKLEQVFQYYQAAKILDSPRLWVEIEHDEHVFYRALSLWVTGTENNHHVIRQHVLEVVRTVKYVIDFLGEEKYQAHLTQISQKSYATEVEIMASAILLDTPIYVYDTSKQTWEFFDQNKTSKEPLTKTDKCIYLQRISINYYNVVTDVKPDPDQDLATILDDDIKIALSSQPEEIRYFNPVDEDWQNEKCNELNLTLEIPFRYNQLPKILNPPMKLIEIKKDENCFFRALSYWITGTENNHQIIRNNIAKILLKTSVFVYSHDKETWNLYNKDIVDKLPVNKIDKCIYLRQMSPNEYDVVEDVKDYFSDEDMLEKPYTSDLDFNDIYGEYRI